NYRIDNYPDGKRDNVDLTLDLLNPLCKSYSIIKDAEFKIYSSEEEKNKIKAYLLSEGLDLDKPILICAVTARIESKVWSKQKMQEILQRVIDKYPNVQLVFNYGGEREKASATDIYNEMNKPSSIFIDVEAKSLEELRALLAISSFFFGNEGGPRHIAQAVGTPSFAIYPPNVNKTTWLPNPNTYNQGIELADINETAASNKQLTFEQKLDLIDVDSVWKQLDKMLGKI
ncbi:MAG: hypothetical protein RL662_260, partial [Bacteroidota bacterium]